MILVYIGIHSVYISVYREIPYKSIYTTILYTNVTKI